MPSVVPRVPSPPERKRKAHVKSRKGCCNCKLRRVKCDEGKPKCKKCVLYGVSCDYDGSKASLDLSAEGAFQIDLARGEATVDFAVAPEQACAKTTTLMNYSAALQKPPVSLNNVATAMVHHSLHDTAPSRADGFVMAGLPHMHRYSAWTFKESDMEIISRFQTRTVSTIGSKQATSTYRDCIAHLAFTHPFLMHMVLSLTLLHDAHLTTTHTSNLSLSFQKASLTHWNTATKLFNALLSRPIAPSHRDAIWATGALLGTASMAYIESSDPEHAWPLKPPDPNDLNWLKLSEGKRAVWQIADPSRPDSMFYALGKSVNHLQQPDWVVTPDFASVPERLARLFDIKPDDTVTSNIYYLPLLCVQRTKLLTLTHELVLPFIRFLLYMTPEFRALLELKDPRAMLLLLWWFRRVEDGHADLWWMTRRAKIEGRAIEIWLGRWYGGEEGLMQMFERVRGGVGEMWISILGLLGTIRRGVDGVSWVGEGEGGGDLGAVSMSCWIFVPS
ncbi:uncharacterized protein N0V89_011147 [Didymosphaeria variabile]|uniref:Zn(2)-C6 fungal-type domain-containing protein n=1 Tax=Didymosphaeria variabile TaxID=1932322 RepID=A0A9W8XCY6_9PLEO|nr:uncharacterized protein N0V89_011147 [Didymosphaeria variabile]KAJ4347208.1 hypothetical protein N0V89_011147 [Didymosphaeria variabile]